MSAPAQTHNTDKVNRVAHALADLADDEEKQSQQAASAAAEEEDDDDEYEQGSGSEDEEEGSEEEEEGEDDEQEESEDYEDNGQAEDEQISELTILSEPAMLAQAAVGLDWTAELVDAPSSLFRYSANPVRSTLTVLRSSTLLDLAPLIEEVYRIPAARQQLWLVLPRSMNLRAHTRLEPRGQHAGWNIKRISLDPTDADEPPRSGPLFIFLRDTHADPRPQPQEAPRAQSTSHVASSAATTSSPLSTVPTCSTPAPGSLVSANSLLILFKLFDVPSQTILYLGSAHFGLAEPVQAIRQFCAELVALRSKEQTPTGEMLRFSLSHLLDEADEPVAADRLSAAHVWSSFEVGVIHGRHFPFNFCERSREIDAQRLGSSLATDVQFKEAPDWNAITTDSCNIQNGQMALFHLRYKPEQLQWLRQSYVQKRQEWADELRINRTLVKPADDASAQAASIQVAIPSLPLRSFKSQFSDTCVQVLEYLAYRVVIEFRAVPPNGASSAASSDPAVTSFVWLELRRDAIYRDTIELLGRELAIDSQHIQLHKPSARKMPAQRAIAQTAHLDWTLSALGIKHADKFAPSPLDDSPAPLLFYSRMKYSWKELIGAVSVIVHYCDQQLGQTTFETLISCKANFRKLAAIAANTFARIRAPLEASSSASASSPPAMPSLLCFSVSSHQSIREFAEHVIVKKVLYDVWARTVYCVEHQPVSEAEAARGVRSMWVHRYYPLGAYYWRPAGVPFPMRIQHSDNLVEFRSRLQARLGLDDARMAQIDVALLKPDDPRTTLAADEIVFNSYNKGYGGARWAALGIYDRAAPKPPASVVLGAWTPTTADEAEAMSRGLPGLDDDDRQLFAPFLLHDRRRADRAGLKVWPSFTWRIPLQKWRDEKRDREYSPEFKLDGENWRILLFPKGNPKHSVQGCMAAYLELRSDRAPYSLVCELRMRMEHPTEPSNYAWRDSTHNFTNVARDRGFNDLLTPATIAEYTHDDGCVVLLTQAWLAWVRGR